MMTADKLDISKIITSVIDTKPNQFNKSMLCSFLNYKYDGNKSDKPSTLVFKLDETELKEGGIFPIHKDWAPTNRKREWFKLSWNRDEIILDNFFKALAMLDDYFSSDEIKKKLVKECGFKKKTVSNFKYTKIIKAAVDNEGETDELTGKPKRSYKESTRIKFKVNNNSIDQENREVTTAMYVKENEVPQRQPANLTISDVEKFLMIGCKCQYVIEIQKIWILKGADSDGNYKYGVSLICRQLAVTVKAPEVGTYVASVYDEYVFANKTETIEKDIIEKDVKKDIIEKDIKKEIKKEIKEEEEEDDSDGEEEDSESN
jgi:hypothetical protein